MRPPGQPHPIPSVASMLQTCRRLIVFHQETVDHIPKVSDPDFTEWMNCDGQNMGDLASQYPDVLTELAEVFRRLHKAIREREAAVAARRSLN